VAFCRVNQSKPIIWRMKRAIFLPLLALPLIACQHQTPAVVHAEEKKPITFDPSTVKMLQPVAGQRFTPTTSPLVSYDGLTGSLCMTYEWAYSGNAGMPLCLQLANLKTTPKTDLPQ
jgi:hypothetical protein